MSNSVQPRRRQPTRLPRSWDSPGKNTGVGCHFLLQCTKVKSESEVAQSCPTLSDPMDCSLPGFSVHGIFQAKLLEWGAIAFKPNRINLHTPQLLLQVLPIKNVSPHIIGEFGFILATSHPFTLLDPAINLSLLQTPDISVCSASLCIQHGELAFDNRLWTLYNRIAPDLMN